MKSSQVFKAISVLLFLNGLGDLVYITYSLYAKFQSQSFVEQIAQAPIAFVIVYAPSLLTDAAKILGSLLGFRQIENTRKINRCLFLGFSAFISGVIGVYFSYFSPTPNTISLCVGLVISAVYIVCAAQRGQEKEVGMQRASGILMLFWSVFDAIFAFLYMIRLQDNYSFITFFYTGDTAERISYLDSLVHAAELQLTIIGLPYFLMQILTGVFAILSIKAPKRAVACMILSIVTTGLNAARLSYPRPGKLGLILWSFIGVSLSFSVLCIVSSVMLIKKNRRSAQ